MTVLLPNRRAQRSLAEAFLAAGEGRTTLLPRLVALGEVDAEELVLAGPEGLFEGAATLALAPALSARRRQFLLGRLVESQARSRGLPLSAAGVAALADELARLLDEAETAEIDLAGLRDLAPERFAAHWQQVLEFLKILYENWPTLERAQGALGPAHRRRLLLAAQAEAWRRAPPPGPVIAAGSTGSIPAVARLLKVVAGLPQGAVVLPGLEPDLGEELAAAIRADPCHPQHGLLLLLETLEVEPRQVPPWPGSAVAGERAHFVQAALRPAAMTDSWREIAAGANAARRRDWKHALAGLSWYECPGPREEALTVALLLRQALETPGRTAALVTPDRGLARRVAGELGRWGLALDDSAGRPLAETPPAVLLRHLVRALEAKLAPVPLLALLKHPLTRMGEAPGPVRRRVRRLERLVLRGPRPAPGFGGLVAALRAQDLDGEERREAAALEHWLDGLAAALAPLTAAMAGGKQSLATLLQAHLAAGEALARPAEGEGGLWQGEAGEALSTTLAEVLEAADDFPPVLPADYPALFEALLAGQVVRPRWGSHPRLFLWGPLEARLQQADLMILGGLNEGTWPALPDPGPWLSRPMRAALGLAPPERRIGQAAHDVAQALAAPEVVLTRAVKVEGTPTLPARWLLRLEALAATLGLGAALPRRKAEPADWSAALDRPLEPPRPAAPPEPRPPLERRPRRLSVTQVETWMSNPYALFARHVLRLEPLPVLDEEPGPKDRGTLVHRVFERFVRALPAALPADAAERLEAIVADELAAAAVHPGLALLWGPRLRRLAGWFLQVEAERRPLLAEILVEQRGRLELAAPGGPFVLIAKADRLERGRVGGVTLIDYKTGQLPRPAEVAAGLAPQLPLEGAMLLAGGFAALGPQPLAGLEHWRVTGARPAGEVKSLAGDAAALAAEAAAGLARLVAAFDDPNTPYHARPRPDALPSFYDYADLPRVEEWTSVGDEE